MSHIQSSGGGMKGGISEGGFTLIELLIAMMLGLVVLGAIYSSFYTQKKTYISQERMVDMGQNLRVALDFITRDVKMAGRSATGDTTLIMGSNLGITTATATSLTLMSVTPAVTGDPASGDYTVIYALNIDDEDIDGDPTIILNRNAQPLAEHFVSVLFEYFDGNGLQIANPNTVALRGSIRKVRVNLVARTENEDPEFTGGFDKNAAVPGTCRTESVAVDVVARNMGL